MAYKFQVGAAILSGSITHKQAATFSSGLSNADQNITNVGDIAIDSISADNNELDIVLTDNQANALEIKEGSNVYMRFATSNGSEIIHASKPMLFGDDTPLGFGDNQEASIEYDEDGGDQLRISAPANGVVIAGTTPTLVIGDAGAEDTKIVYDGNAQDYYIGLDDSDDSLKIGLGESVGTNAAITLNTSANATFAGDVTVAGNLTVQGSSVEIQQGFVVTSSVQFEGATPDGNEISLTSADPSADRTITLPDLSGHVPLIADAASAASIAVTAAEFALLDGGATVGTDSLADADGFLHNDNGTMKQTQVVKIAELAFSKISGDATVASNGALTIAAGAVEGSMVADDLISAQDNLGGTGVAQADEFLFSDDGTLKAITFSNLEDAIFGNVSGDIAVAAGGAATIQANAVEGSMLNNNIVSGLDDIGAAIADTDEMIISDAGTIKRTDFSRLKTYIGSGVVTVTAFGDADATLAKGVNYASANTSAARTLTLPASAGLSAGDSVRVKVAGVSSGAVTIARAGSQTIDGNLTSVVLESDNAAIELVYVAADDWRIF
tara:strand:- start:3989 stop:5653 length:1665 start_codon:yes stop_codon:yes gene_type:complete